MAEEEIRHALLLDQIPKEPGEGLPPRGAARARVVRSSDGTVSFDGAQVRIDSADASDRVKRATGPRIIAVGDLVQVEWLPNSGYEDGFLRFVTRETVFSKLPPEKIPFALDLWQRSRDLLTALVAAAVTAHWRPSLRADEHVDRPPQLTAAAGPGSAPGSSIVARPTITTYCCGGCGSWASCIATGCSRTRSSRRPRRRYCGVSRRRAPELS